MMHAVHIHIYVLKIVTKPLKLYLFCSILVLFSRCTAQESRTAITDKSEFEEYSGPPLTNKYGSIHAVKVLYSFEEDMVYFINYHEHKLHYNYCQQLNAINRGMLRNSSDNLHLFNKKNYGSSDDKDYLLGNINYISGLNKYALELSATDQMSIAQLHFFYNKVAQSGFWGKDLVVYLNNQRLSSQAKRLSQLFPIILPSDIYQSINYQAISKSQCNGNLVLVTGDKSQQFKKTDILLYEHTPLQLPNVAGIIVSELQTPLSHLTILGQNRGIPICAIKNVLTDTSIAQLINKNVFYQVTSENFTLKTSNRSSKKTTPHESINLKANFLVDSLLNIVSIRKKHKNAVGNKAYNFSQLHKLSIKADFETPEGAFAIPFYFYKRHIDQNQITTLINSLPTTGSSDIDSVLKHVRYLIKRAPLQQDFLQAVEQKIITNGNYTRMRFRSSTNAEDAVGFSGAGLYSSKTGMLHSSKKPIDKAIKSVWASLWSYDAYMERQYFGIDDTQLSMAILVHRSFPNEAANGVAITKNLYRPDNFGFVINAQWGEASVVNPKPGVICDQFICYPAMGGANLYTEKNVIDILTTSSLGDGSLVMTPTEIAHLANQLERIKRYFSVRTISHSPYTDFGLDVEFKLDGSTRQLYVKQVRVYND